MSDTTPTTPDGRPLSDAERALLEAFRATGGMSGEEARRRLQAVRYESRREVPPPAPHEAKLLAGICDTLGFGEALHRLMGDHLPPEPEAMDPPDDDQEDEAREGDEGQEGDDDDQDDDQEQEPALPRRRAVIRPSEPDPSELPLIRQSMTVAIPWDHGRMVTIEAVVAAAWDLDDSEGASLSPHAPETRAQFTQEAGWYSYGVGDHEVFFRVIGG